MNEKIETKDIPLPKNFISADKNRAMNSYGKIFDVGERVKHQDRIAGESIIFSFQIDDETNEILAKTYSGHAHIDFLLKI